MRPVALGVLDCGLDVAADAADGLQVVVLVASGRFLGPDVIHLGGRPGSADPAELEVALEDPLARSLPVDAIAAVVSGIAIAVYSAGVLSGMVGIAPLRDEREATRLAQGRRTAVAMGHPMLVRNQKGDWTSWINSTWRVGGAVYQTLDLSQPRIAVLYRGSRVRPAASRR